MPRAPPRERTYVHPRPAQRPPVDVVEDETTTITFPAGSDGDLKSLPPTKKVEEEGKIDALDQVPLDDKTATAWRLEIGTLLGRHVLGLDEDSLRWIDKFPEGYALYVRTTGPVESPRRDYYLYGCKEGHIFRSAREFFPHAKHLFESAKVAAKKKQPCECTYCSKTPQRTIRVRYPYQSPRKSAAS